MKVSKYKIVYEEFTSKLSDINRNIAFAAIAIIWIFKQTTNGGAVIVPKDLFFPTILIVLALGFDLLQYIYQSIAWTIFFHYYEFKGIKKKDASYFMLVPSWILFIIKVGFVVWAYYYIFSYLYKTLFCSAI